MEHKARLYEGHTEKVVFTGIEGRSRQYELWPKRASDRREMKWLAVGILFIVLIVASTAVWARPATISKGLFCESVEALTEAVEGVTATNATFTEVEGCGMFVANGRVPVDITILAEYETDFATFTVIRVEIPGLGTKYGYGSFTPKAPRSDA